MRRVLIDEQLPRALVRLLAANGHAAEHVFELSMRRASDSAVWASALASGAVIVTKDEDYAQMTSWKSGGPRVVWLRWPNMSRAALGLFQAILPSLEVSLQGSETLIEVR